MGRGRASFVAASILMLALLTESSFAHARRCAIPSGGWVAVNPRGAPSVSTETPVVEAGGRLLVFGHSEGSQVAGRWMEAYAVADSTPTNELSFILLGNPERKYGRPPWDVNFTGADTITPGCKYNVKDVTRLGDGWSNYPSPANRFNTTVSIFSWAAAIAGMFFIHPYYHTVNLDTLDSAALDSYVEGNTTYYVVV